MGTEGTEERMPRTHPGRGGGKGSSTRSLIGFANQSLRSGVTAGDELLVWGAVGLQNDVRATELRSCRSREKQIPRRFAARNDNFMGIKIPVRMTRFWDGTTVLESYADAELGGEGNAYRCSGTEEISEGSSGDAQRVQVGEGQRRGAGGIGAVRCDIAALRLCRRYWKQGDVGYVIRARVVAIEKIEKFCEGDDRPAVVEVEGASDAKINLDVGSSAEFIETGPDSIDHDAVAVVRQRDCKRSCAFGLSHGGKLESAGDIEGSGENEAGGDVLAGGAVVSWAEGVLWIADAVNIVKQFT